MYRLIFFLLLAGCSAAQPMTCQSQIEQKKDYLGNIDTNTNCLCACPTSTSTFVDGLGVIGGLLNLANNGTK